jgi:hypothetical protein
MGTSEHCQEITQADVICRPLLLARCWEGARDAEELLWSYCCRFDTAANTKSFFAWKVLLLSRAFRALTGDSFLSTHSSESRRICTLGKSLEVTCNKYLSI